MPRKKFQTPSMNAVLDAIRIQDEKKAARLLRAFGAAPPPGDLAQAVGLCCAYGQPDALLAVYKLQPLAKTHPECLKEALENACASIHPNSAASLRCALEAAGCAACSALLSLHLSVTGNPGPKFKAILEARRREFGPSCGIELPPAELHPLYWAISGRSLECAKLAVALGLPCGPNSSGQSPAAHALDYAEPEILGLVLDSGADPCQPGPGGQDLFAAACARREYQETGPYGACLDAIAVRCAARWPAQTLAMAQNALLADPGLPAPACRALAEAAELASGSPSARPASRSFDSPRRSL